MKVDKKNSLYIYTDGGARGNPGPAAVGVCIKDENGKILWEQGKVIGETTNNVAEYKAVVMAFDWIENNPEIINQYTHIDFFLDSQLVVRQLSGVYKMKSENLRSFLFTIREKEAGIKIPIMYTHIPREKNTQADSLVNKALDGV